jgi:hypothetical protein
MKTHIKLGLPFHLLLSLCNSCIFLILAIKNTKSDTEETHLITASSTCTLHTVVPYIAFSHFYGPQHMIISTALFRLKISLQLNIASSLAHVKQKYLHSPLFRLS